MLEDLIARLPELEWKLSAYFTVLSLQQLPRGLFLDQLTYTPKTCIDEIKADLKTLERTSNQRASHYLAERISQKIHVLVRLCQLQANKAKLEARTKFSLQSISTRQQWLQSLHVEVETRQAQKQALTNKLNSLPASTPLDLRLAIQAELGQVERCLSVAEETLQQNSQ